MLRFALFAALVASLVGTTTGCIASCACHKNEDGLVMVCEELTQLPNFELARSSNSPLIKELYLQNSSIAVLGDNSFRGLPNLRVLSILRNKVTRFSWKIVNNLNKLEQINLVENPITMIEEGASMLPNIKAFTMNGHSVVRLPNGFFPRSIETIRLDNGMLDSIPTLDTPKLTFFSAKKNRITDLQRNVFRSVTPAKGASLVIDLSENPVVRINGEFIRQRSELPGCVTANPADMRGNSLYWVQLRVGNAQCDKCEVNDWVHFLSPDSLYPNFRMTNSSQPVTGIQIRDWVREQCGGNYICSKLPSNGASATMTPFSVLAATLFAFLAAWMM